MDCTLSPIADCFDYELIAIRHSQFDIICLVMGADHRTSLQPNNKLKLAENDTTVCASLFSRECNQDQHGEIVFTALHKYKGFIWLTLTSQHHHSMTLMRHLVVIIKQASASLKCPQSRRQKGNSAAVGAMWRSSGALLLKAYAAATR